MFLISTIFFCKNNILILQKRSLRLMFFGDYNSHGAPVSSSFLPLDLLYFKSVAILIHDISNSWKATNISNLFASQSNIYSFNTRSSSRGDYRYVKRHSRLDKQTKSFSRYGVRIWNIIVYRVECLKCPKITLKSMSTTVYSEYFQKKTIILIYRTYL